MKKHSKYLTSRLIGQENIKVKLKENIFINIRRF